MRTYPGVPMLLMTDSIKARARHRIRPSRRVLSERRGPAPHPRFPALGLPTPGEI